MAKALRIVASTALVGGVTFLAGLLLRAALPDPAVDGWVIGVALACALGLRLEVSSTVAPSPWTLWLSERLLIGVSYAAVLALGICLLGMIDGDLQVSAGSTLGSLAVALVVFALGGLGLRATRRAARATEASGRAARLEAVRRRAREKHHGDAGPGAKP